MASKPGTIISALAIATAALVGSASVAHSNGAKGDTSAKAAKADGAPSTRVCRNRVLSGTRLSTRICRAQADWDKDEEEAKRLVQKGQVNGQSRDGEMNGNYRAGGPTPR